MNTGVIMLLLLFQRLERGYKMEKIKKGDMLRIKSCEGLPYFYTGVIDIITFNNIPCVFLATDLKNKNTFARFTQQNLAKHGYYI